LIKSGALYRWELLDDGYEVAVEATVINDPMYALDLARAGVGLAYVMEPVVRADIAAGHLTQVLPKSSSEWPGLFSITQSRVGAEAPGFYRHNKRSLATPR
jgi:DNA-binding transcriptional LysR family regulator